MKSLSTFALGVALALGGAMAVAPSTAAAQESSEAPARKFKFSKEGQPPGRSGSRLHHPH